MTHALAVMPDHPQPVNRQAALAVARSTFNDELPLTPEEKVERCKRFAKAIRKDYPDAVGKYSYLLNVAAQEMGYKSYDGMRQTLGLMTEYDHERKTLFQENQALTKRVLELEEQLRQHGASPLCMFDDQVK